MTIEKKIESARGLGNLTSWERNFLDSIHPRMISVKQIEKLDEILEIRQRKSHTPTPMWPLVWLLVFVAMGIGYFIGRAA